MVFRRPVPIRLKLNRFSWIAHRRDLHDMAKCFVKQGACGGGPTAAAAASFRTLPDVFSVINTDCAKRLKRRWTSLSAAVGRTLG